MADKARLEQELVRSKAAAAMLAGELEEKVQKQMVDRGPRILTLTEEGWQKGLKTHKGRVRKMREKLARAFAEVGVMGEEFRGVEEQQMQERNGQHQWGREQQARVSALQREMRLAEEREEQRVARDKGLVEARMCTEQKLQL